MSAAEVFDWRLRPDDPAARQAAEAARALVTARLTDRTSLEVELARVVGECLAGVNGGDSDWLPNAAVRVSAHASALAAVAAVAVALYAHGAGVSDHDAMRTLAQILIEERVTL